MEIEKVRRGLECLIHMTSCIGCPYWDRGRTRDECLHVIGEDALTMLKEQEAVKPKSKVRHGANAQIQHFCGNCNSMLHGKPKYCSECGKGVLW